LRDFPTEKLREEKRKRPIHQKHRLFLLESIKFTMTSSADDNVRREDVLALDEQRRDLESQLEALYSSLSSQGASMDEPLVDQEGFPRSDVDVYQVRHIRSQINRLRNDHKALMLQIESGLHNLHKQSREGVGLPPEANDAGREANEAMEVVPEAFCKVSSEEMRKGSHLLFLSRFPKSPAALRPTFAA